MQWGQLDNANVQHLTYRHASRTLKQLARHPLATLLSLQLYDLQRTFTMSMAGKTLEHHLQLLMAHRRFGAHTAAILYQPGYVPMDITAILSGAPANDPHTHSHQQEAAGWRHREGLQEIWSCLES